MTEQTPETPAPEAPEAAEQTQVEAPVQPDDNSPEEQSEAWDPERAKEKIRRINSENKQLRERAAQAEKQVESLPDLQRQTETLGSENLRLKVGYELGLPMNLAVRLQGSTRDELVTDAQSLVELVAPTKPALTSGRPVADLKPGATPEAYQNEDDANYARLFGPNAR